MKKQIKTARFIALPLMGAAILTSTASIAESVELRSNTTQRGGTVEELLYSSDVDEVLKLTDVDQLKKSHAAGLAVVKGQLVYFKRELLKQNMNPIHKTTAAIVDQIQMEISSQLGKIQSPYFDTRALLKSQMEITADKSCKTARDLFNGDLSIHNVCPKGDVTYRLEQDSGQWYLTGLKSDSLNAALDTMKNRISSGKKQ